MAGAGWTEKDEAMEVATSCLPVMSTVGWCIHHCRSHIALTDSWGDNEYGQVTKIPMGNVVVLWELEEDPKEPLYTNKEILNGTT